MSRVTVNLSTTEGLPTCPGYAPAVLGEVGSDWRVEGVAEFTVGGVEVEAGPKRWRVVRRGFEFGQFSATWPWLARVRDLVMPDTWHTVTGVVYSVDGIGLGWHEFNPHRALKAGDRLALAIDITIAQEYRHAMIRYLHKARRD